jgi:hypothetical protein
MPRGSRLVATLLAASPGLYAQAPLGPFVDEPLHLCRAPGRRLDRPVPVAVCSVILFSSVSRVTEVERSIPAVEALTADAGPRGSSKLSRAGIEGPAKN